MTSHLHAYRTTASIIHADSIQYGAVSQFCNFIQQLAHGINAVHGSVAATACGGAVNLHDLCQSFFRAAETWSNVAATNMPPASTGDGAFPLMACQQNCAAVTNSDNRLTCSNGHFVSGIKWICLQWKSTCIDFAASATGGGRGNNLQKGSTNTSYLNHESFWPFVLCVSRLSLQVLKYGWEFMKLRKWKLSNQEAKLLLMDKIKERLRDHIIQANVLLKTYLPIGNVLCFSQQHSFAQSCPSLGVNLQWMLQMLRK